jgi:hypothetical protein
MTRTDPQPVETPVYTIPPKPDASCSRLYGYLCRLLSEPDPIAFADQHLISHQGNRFAVEIILQDPDVDISWPADTTILARYQNTIGAIVTLPGLAILSQDERIRLIRLPTPRFAP